MTTKPDTPLERAARAATVAFREATDGAMYLKDGTNLVIARAVIDALGLSWQPIETAPRDGTAVLAWGRQKGARLVYWEHQWEEWMTIPTKFPHKPTHWLPLPDPPEGT